MSNQFSELASALLTGLVAGLGVSETVTYYSLRSDYDVLTSEVVETRTSVTAAGAIFYTDRKTLALMSRLAARGSVDTIESELPSLTVLIPGDQLSTVTPKANDVVKRGTTEYTIESVSVDPVGAVYIFALRLP